MTDTLEDRPYHAIQTLPAAVINRLYPAAIKAFAESDFQHVGMRDISAASGVSTATIYKYFASKEALLFAILRQELDAIDRDIARVIELEADHPHKWRACFCELMRHYEERPDLAIVYFITVPTKTWIAEGSWESFGSGDRLRALAQEGQAAGLLDATISPSMCISLVFMHCAREIQLWYHHGRRWRLSERADHIFQVFWKTIARTPV
ncbi:MAG: TetR/AcrR family transcriptional regulator [Beijerinckiaceae bacterium]|nr:TetR/AcrR family transcriptional regulator [Beijerinckiaceae bacterium]